ncbi:MAG TPA: hypothetical protein VJT84_09760 [Gaiellaceae bacterium]|nr:hypothetical protein [Gaiellaceae bacterium]
MEIPIYTADGTPSGETVRVEEPPPDRWQLGPGSVLELRRFRRLERFGCGCIWEERLAYVRAASTDE